MSLAWYLSFTVEYVDIQSNNLFDLSTIFGVGDACANPNSLAAGEIVGSTALP